MKPEEEKAEQKETAVESGSNIATADHFLGIWVGYKEIADIVLKESGELFANCQDEKAKIYREISYKIADLANRKRREYELQYTPLRDKGFARLEEIDIEVATQQRVKVK